MAWTLARLEQGDEVRPHLQLLLSPLCLPVVPVAFKAPLPTERCPLRVLAQGNTPTSWGCRTGLGQYPEHLPNLVLLRGAAAPRQPSPWRAARQGGVTVTGWAQLLFKVLLVFPTSEMACGGESWQELRGDLSCWRQVATITLLKVPGFCAPPGLVLCLLVEMVPVAEDADNGLGGSPCAQSPGLIPTQKTWTSSVMAVYQIWLAREERGPARWPSLAAASTAALKRD